jgi:hypothetical protein
LIQPDVEESEPRKKEYVRKELIKSEELQI